MKNAPCVTVVSAVQMNGVSIIQTEILMIAGWRNAFTAPSFSKNKNCS